MGKVPVRKRLKHVKKGKRKPACSDEVSAVQKDVCSVTETEPCVQVEQVSVGTPGGKETSPKTQILNSTSRKMSIEESSWDSVRSSNFHDYTSTVMDERSRLEPNKLEDKLTITIPNLDVLEEVKKRFDCAFLFPNCVSVLERNGLSVLLLSRDIPRTTQRSVFVSYLGSAVISVHCKPICSDSFVKDVAPPSPLCLDSVNEFVDRVASIVRNVRIMEVCAGVDSEDFERVWSLCTGGEVDKNPYRESRYVETFRSLKCTTLVQCRTWRCVECSKLLRPLRRKLALAKRDKILINTPNIHLSKEQMLQKMKDQRKDLDAAKKKLKRLHDNIQDLVKKEGVPVDGELYSDLIEALKAGELSPAHEIFLHQQVKAANVRKRSGMRWHPTMIRLALALHLTSPSAYQLLRDTGMVKLPSSRTLFDYSHVTKVEEGIDETVISSVAERVKLLSEKYQKYHVLIADEMYISKNLVFQKSSGRVIGYTKLDEVDREVRMLNEFLDSPDQHSHAPCSEEIASRVLCYMIKGTANSIKEVVASFAVANVSAHQMYLWTWHVIGALERNAIWIIAFVCDGSSINRAFINMHIPFTKEGTASGLVFDTTNKAAPHRPLFFFSDVAHLLKTIRNCFYKSRADIKKGKRCLRRNGKKIVWDYIIRLYKEDKHKTLRKSFKLNPVNVFPDAYSCMKVSYAAQVLSRTVASNLKLKNYKGVSETVHFITETNDWFDRLNGAHSTMGRKKKNDNLAPYVSSKDGRFDKLLGFLKYLSDWKAQAYGVDVSLSCTVDDTCLDQSNVSDCEVSFNPVEDNYDGVEEEDNLKASQRVLSHQTQLGIEISTRSFINCVKFLLKEGTHFINARIFSQDPLEQHFSKQRAGGGGSSNPNLQRFLSKNRAIHTFGQLGMKNRRGNTEVEESHVEITVERLPKRRCVRSTPQVITEEVI